MREKQGVKIRGGEEEMRGRDANNGEISIDERKQAEDTARRGKDWVERQISGIRVKALSDKTGNYSWNSFFSVR